MVYIYILYISLCFENSGRELEAADTRMPFQVCDILLVVF